MRFLQALRASAGFGREAHRDLGGFGPNVLIGNDGRHKAKLVCASRTEWLTQEN